MGVIEEVNNLICEKCPHEHVWVQSPKVQLRCPLVKAWVTSDVLEGQNQYYYFTKHLWLPLL